MIVKVIADTQESHLLSFSKQDNRERSREDPKVKTVIAIYIKKKEEDRAVMNANEQRDDQPRNGSSSRALYGTWHLSFTK